MFAAGCSPSGERKAPPLVLPSLDGSAYDLSAAKGKPVLVVFWATWCDGCREELPALDAMYKRADGRYGVVAVSLDEDRKAVPPFVKEHELTLPVLLGENPVARSWGVRGLPTSFLVGPDGAIQRRWVGSPDLRAVENDIVAVLNRRPS